MKTKNIKHRFLSLRDAGKAAAASALTTAMVMAPAFAQSGDFDPSPIIAKFVAYTAIGITLLGAFALAVWSLRAMGLIGGKR